jgi:hypothetical protein
VDDELYGVMAPSLDAVPRTTRESPTLATTIRPLWTAWCSRSGPRPSAATPELVVRSDACGHVGLFPEVELTVTKLLLVVDERRQRERLLLVVFVRGFQVRNMDSSLTLVYENDSQVRYIEKYYRE